jgi:hypothetical protein
MGLAKQTMYWRRMQNSRWSRQLEKYSWGTGNLGHTRISIINHCTRTSILYHPEYDILAFFADKIKCQWLAVSNWANSCSLQLLALSVCGCRNGLLRQEETTRVSAASSLKLLNFIYFVLNNLLSGLLIDI